MKRISLVIFFVALVFILPPLVSLILLFITAILTTYNFYEILFFGPFLDIISTQEFPIYTLASLVLFGFIFLIRKRILLHV